MGVVDAAGAKKMPTKWDSELFQYFQKRKVWKVIPICPCKSSPQLHLMVQPSHAFAMTMDSENNYILTANSPVNVEEVYQWMAPLVAGQAYIAVPHRTYVPTGIDTTETPYATYMAAYKHQHKPDNWRIR